MKAAQAAESVGWKIVRQLGEGGQADVSLAARRDAPDGPTTGSATVRGGGSRGPGSAGESRRPTCTNREP
jgi:hypothetical protein